MSEQNSHWVGLILNDKIMYVLSHDQGKVGINPTLFMWTAYICFHKCGWGFSCMLSSNFLSLILIIMKDASDCHEVNYQHAKYGLV